MLLAGLTVPDPLLIFLATPPPLLGQKLDPSTPRHFGTRDLVYTLTSNVYTKEPKNSAPRYLRTSTQAILCTQTSKVYTKESWPREERFSFCVHNLCPAAWCVDEFCHMCTQFVFFVHDLVLFCVHTVAKVYTSSQLVVSKCRGEVLVLVTRRDKNVKRTKAKTRGPLLAQARGLTIFSLVILI